MIKLIPAKTTDKKLILKMISEGRTFTTEIFVQTVDLHKHTIHLDFSFGNNPIRCGTRVWSWKNLPNLHEITESHWYDNIPEEGVLCWVWDRYKRLDVAQIVKSYYKNTEKPFITSCGRWLCAIPVTAKDIYQEPV